MSHQKSCQPCVFLLVLFTALSRCWVDTVSANRIINSLWQPEPHSSSNNLTTEGTNTPGRWGSEEARQEESNSKKWLAADTEWPSHSTHYCVGKDYTTRTCLFTNIVYNKDINEWYYYPANPPANNMWELENLKYGSNFTLKVVNTPIIARDGAYCYEYEPVYLTDLFNPHSFGHMVRDLFYQMTGNLYDLGIQDHTRMIVAPRVMGVDDANVGYRTGTMRILQKYSRWISMGASYLNDVVTPCSTYTMFRDIVFGSFVFELKTSVSTYIVPHWWGEKPDCKQNFFQKQRDLAYKLNGLNLVPPAWEHPRVKVLFGDKSVTDSRRIINIPELIPALQARFPSFLFDSKTLSLIPPLEQLQEMSTTTIFISPHASSSFRMVYLPTGAHTIIVGPPELDGHLEPAAFREIHECWENLGYMTINGYHVTERTEVEYGRFVREYVPNKDYYKWFDSDSRLEVNKLGDLIQAAVDSIRTARSDQEF